MKRSQKPGGFAVTVCVLAAVAGIGYAMRGDPVQRPSRSIAILPFVTEGGDPQGDALGNGLAEELIDSLGRASEHVVARTSAFQFRNPMVGVREIGKKLNVKTILEGKIAHSNIRLRVSVRLEDTETGFQIWSQNYDGDLNDTL